MNCAKDFDACVLVIAAVSVVFPWSTCPIVPTLTCGFVRSNFAFAIPRPPLPRSASAARPPTHRGPRDQDGGWDDAGGANLEPTTGFEPVTLSLPRTRSAA